MASPIKIFIGVCLVFLLFFVLMLNYSVKVLSFNDSQINRNAYPKNVEGFLGYSTYPNNQSVDILHNKDIKKEEVKCVKVKGVDGLVCSPDQYPENPKDIFQTATSSATCGSYGLTNSKGHLCLDDKHLKYLTTRGGNATFDNGKIN